MTTRELRLAITALAKAKRSRRYGPDLRAAVVEHARARMAQGATAAGICRELDISEPMLARFLAIERPPWPTSGSRSPTELGSSPS